MGCSASYFEGKSGSFSSSAARPSVSGQKASSTSRKSHSKDGDKESVESFPVDLTERQRELVRSTWNGLRTQATRIGMEVFHEIFRREPSTKDLFRFSQMSVAQLQTDPVFRGHATRFMQAVGAVIDNLDNTDGQLQAMLLHIGGRHNNYNSFDKSYFAAFTFALMDVVERYIGKERFRGEMREAWTAVIHYMLHEIRTGYIKTQNQIAVAGVKAGNGTAFPHE